MLISLYFFLTFSKIFDIIFLEIKERKERITINHGVIKTIAELPDNAEINDIAFCEEQGCAVAFSENGWVPIPKDTAINLGMNEYDFNKLVVAQMPVADNEQIENYRMFLRDFFNDKCTFDRRNYFALLAYDRRDFTVFAVNRANLYNEENAEDIVLEILANRGKIHSIDWADDTHTTIDCWVSNDDGVYIYKLFDYDWGVVECG